MLCPTWAKQSFWKYSCHSGSRRDHPKRHTNSWGTRGLSLKSVAVSRYSLIAEFRIAFIRELSNMVYTSNSKLSHQDLQQTRIIKDDLYEISLLEVIRNNWIDLFSGDHTKMVSQQPKEHHLMHRKVSLMLMKLETGDLCTKTEIR